MPLYNFRCPKCNKTFEAFAKVEERSVHCSCGWEAKRLLSAPTIKGPMQPYTSPIDGRWIEGERQRRDDLARSGCIPYDPEMKKDSERFRVEKAAALDRSIDAAVEAAASEVGIN